MHHFSVPLHCDIVCKHVGGGNLLWSFCGSWKNTVKTIQIWREMPRIEVNCARREARFRPTVEQDQSETTTCVKSCVNCSKNCQHPWVSGLEVWHTLVFSSSRLTGNASKNRTVVWDYSIYIYFFYALLIFKAVTEENTYNLAHMVLTNRKTLSHLKGVQVDRSPHYEYELWTLNPWITKQNPKNKNQKN